MALVGRGENDGVRPSPIIDPRMAARREEVYGRHLRRRFHALVALAGILVLVAVALGAARSPLLALERTVVRAPLRAQTTRNQVTFVAGLAHQPGLVEVDVDAVARRVARLPWVETVAVDRQWPHTVTISFTERRAVAQVAGATGQWLVVDSSGRVLAARSSPSPDLVTVAGPPVAGTPGMGLGPAWSGSLDLATQLPVPLRTVVSSVGAVGADLRLTLVNGGTVRLCGDDRLASKLAAAATMLANVDPASLGMIDVCVPSAPALSPKSAPLPPPASGPETPTSAPPSLTHDGPGA